MTQPHPEEITIHHIQDGDDIEEETGEIAVDIYKTEKEIMIIAPVSGVSKDNINIRINENILIISGKRLSPPTAGGTYVVKECFWGKFSRMIVLPPKVDVSHVKASFKNGILIIMIPVIFEPKEKIVPIQDA
jgi:HSP20 family protein